MNPKGPEYGLSERTKAKSADAPDVNPAGMSAAPHGGLAGSFVANGTKWFAIYFVC
jgi:hypothetical protein